MVRRWMKRFAFALAAIGLLVLFGERGGDPARYPPADGDQAVEITIVSHGYHAGIILARADIVRVAMEDGLDKVAIVAERFSAHGFLEIGWGEEGFYRNVPALRLDTVSHALKALFWPFNQSVLHVVGFSSSPEIAFPQSKTMRLRLSALGFRALLRRLEASFGKTSAPEELGPGLYGQSRFFRAEGAFSIFQVCNHWVAGLLNEASVPVNLTLATLPAGLFEDLKWRSRSTLSPRN